ncbi:MAG TPA: hypothetical protein VIQ31_13325, partial [Phormidium sp.]
MVSENNNLQFVRKYTQINPAIELSLSAYIRLHLRFYYSLFPVVAADNLTPKHNIIVDVVKNH